MADTVKTAARQMLHHNVWCECFDKIENFLDAEFYDDQTVLFDGFDDLDDDDPGTDEVIGFRVVAKKMDFHGFTSRENVTLIGYIYEGQIELKSIILINGDRINVTKFVKTKVVGR